MIYALKISSFNPEKIKGKLYIILKIGIFNLKILINN